MHYIIQENFKKQEKEKEIQAYSSKNKILYFTVSHHHLKHKNITTKKDNVWKH